MKYFKRLWDEDRGDAHADWGTSIWYFEVDEQWSVVRQLEAYANGRIHKYSSDHLEDEFGMLADQPLDPKEEYLPFEITEEEFEREWSRPPSNR